MSDFLCTFAAKLAKIGCMKTTELQNINQR